MVGGIRGSVRLRTATRRVATATARLAKRVQTCAASGRSYQGLIVERAQGWGSCCRQGSSACADSKQVWARDRCQAAR